MDELESLRARCDFLEGQIHRRNTVIESLRAEVARLTAELQSQKDAAPLCDKHQPDGGKRAVCLVCGLMKQSAALSQISYACGEPNEMQCGPYDIHCDEDAVVEQVKRLTAERDALRVDAERYRWLRDVGDATWRPFGSREGYSGQQADAAIDAARAAKGTT